VKRRTPRRAKALPPPTVTPSTFPIQLLDRNEVARVCHVHVWIVDKWVLAGHLKPLALPPAIRRRNGDRRLRRVLFDARDVLAFLEGAKADAK
jgi:hypothetical protein